MKKVQGWEPRIRFNLFSKFLLTLNGEIAWLRVSTEALFLPTVSVILFDAASSVVAASLHSVRFFFDFKNLCDRFFYLISIFICKFYKL